MTPLRHIFSTNGPAPFNDFAGNFSLRKSCKVLRKYYLRRGGVSFRSVFSDNDTAGKCRASGTQGTKQGEAERRGRGALAQGAQGKRTRENAGGTNVGETNAGERAFSRRGSTVGRRTRGRTGNVRTRREKPRHFGIRFKFAVLIGALIVALMVVDALWNIDLQQQQAENEAREKAEVLADQMHAMWDFIDINQNIVNRNEDGTFRTKTLVCVVAAKSVSMLFTARRPTTPSASRTPDPAPGQSNARRRVRGSRAFEAFASDPTLEAYYDVDDERGRPTGVPLPGTLVRHGQAVPGMPWRPDRGNWTSTATRRRACASARSRGAMSIVDAHGHLRCKACKTSVVSSRCSWCCCVLAMASIGILCGREQAGAAKPHRTGWKTGRQAASAKATSTYHLAIEERRPRRDRPSSPSDFDKMAAPAGAFVRPTWKARCRARPTSCPALNDLLSCARKAELKNALDRLSEETEYKNDFFAIMSHELRTPLTSILAFARHPARHRHARRQGRKGPWRRSRPTPPCCSTW